MAKIVLRKFDGQKGVLDARAFIQAVHTCREEHTTDVLTEGVTAGLVKNAIVPDSAAYFYFVTGCYKAPGNWDTWTKIEARLREQYCRPWSNAEEAEQKRKLVLQPGEDVDMFVNRIDYYVIERDHHMTQAVRESAGYIAITTAGMRSMFLEGLPDNVLQNLNIANMDTATYEEIVTAARTTMTLQKGRRTQAVATTPKPDSVNALEHLAEQLAALNYKSSGNSNKSNKPYDDENEIPKGTKPKAPLEELRRRPLKTCSRCRQMVKHNGDECKVALRANGSLVKPMRPKGRQPANSANAIQSEPSEQVSSMAIDWNLSN